MSRVEELKQNLKTIQNKISDRAKLIAVSKTFPASDVEHLYKIGQRDFGENKVQDLLEKATELKDRCPEIRWHFIGGLQSNKINNLLKVPSLVSIHSIDRLSLLKKIAAKTIENSVGLFLQVNTSGESEKGGFESEDELIEAIELIENSPFYHQGFMTMGSIRSEDFEASARKSFSHIVELNQRLGSSKTEISQGMSADFELALEIGTDWVRVGRAIFGNRVNIT
jgi:pyridoxal phosphate enzyme (YggS family)